MEQEQAESDDMGRTNSSSEAERDSSTSNSSVASSSGGGERVARQDEEKKVQGRKKESFAHIYESIRGQPVIVTNVIIANNRKTQTWFLKRELGSLEKCTSFDTMKDEIFKSFTNLMALDILKEVDVLCDIDDTYVRDPRISPSSSDNSSTSPTPTPVAITFNVNEKGDLMFNGGTYIQSGEGLLELNAQLKNRLLGIAETLEANVSMGAKSSTVYAISMKFPKVFDKGVSSIGVESKLHRQRKSYEQYSSYKEHVLGTELSLLSNGRNDVGYEFLWRALTPNKDASRFIKKESGHNVKSALRWIYTYETDNSSNDARGGVSLQSKLEVAGLGFDSQFLRHIKHELDIFSKYRISQFMQTTATFGFSTGIISPWSLHLNETGSASSSSSTAVCDRLFVGGASYSLRGFHLHGVGPMGPRSDGESFDSLGGTAMASCHAGLTFNLFPRGRLPFQWMEVLRDLNVRGHIFLNGGNNVYLASSVSGGESRSTHQDSPSVTPHKLNSGAPAPTLYGNSGFSGTSHDFESVGSVIQQFVHGFRLSCGAGVVVPTSMGDFEFNYCHILRHQETDRVRVGWQVNFCTSTMRD